MRDDLQGRRYMRQFLESLFFREEKCESLCVFRIRNTKSTQDWIERCEETIKGRTGNIKLCLLTFKTFQEF